MLENKNPDIVKEMFNEIALRYDFINNIISFWSHFWVKKYALRCLKIKSNYNVLDLCCGSGDLASIVKANNKIVNVIGVDFSSSMLQIARKKNSDIKFIEADATKIPFPDEYFDCVLIGFGLRNIHQPKVALNEINRVLKVGGKFLHLDFNSSAKLNWLYDKIISFLIKFFVENEKPYLYLLKTKNEYFNNEQLIELFSEHGFKYLKSEKKLFQMIAFQIMEKN